MNIFGDKEKVAIEYQLIPSPHEEEELLKKSWGILKLWITGQDICEYNFNGVKNNYEWNLIYVIEWLCNKLEYILGHDPFPLPVQGRNILELIQESDKFESEEEDEDYLWYRAKSLWIFRHSWFSNRAGSILASVYFRRIGDDIEIAWNNNFFEEKQVFFTKPMGNYLISKADFKKILFDFLNDILSNLENDLGKNAKIGDQSIADLRKKIRLLE